MVCPARGLETWQPVGRRCLELAAGPRQARNSTLKATGDLQLLKHNGLLCGGLLWHQSGMANKRKNPAAVALGRRGGLKGGNARARKLSAKRRREIARKAVNTRWARRKKAMKH